MTRSFVRKNSFFLVPFGLWLIIGAWLYIQFQEDFLFFSVNGSHTPFLDCFMTALSAYGRGDCITLLLVSLFLLKPFRSKFYVILFGCFGLFTSIPVYLLKLLFARPRPLSVYALEQVHTVPWLDNFFENSFPSGHTIGAFSFFFLLTILLPNYHKPYGLLFFLLALGVAISRIYLGQHFFTDVYIGSIIGVLISGLVYLMVCKFVEQKETL